MSETGHTPGPWTFRAAGFFEAGTKDGQRLPYPDHVVKVDLDDQSRRRTRFICECNGAGLPNDANARLIAAAPALLEALKRRLNQCGCRMEGGARGSCLACQPDEDLIAKAEGRS